MLPAAVAGIVLYFYRVDGRHAELNSVHFGGETQDGHPMA